VTDVNPIRNEIISNTKRLFVMASPIVKVAENTTKSNINWRRRSMSPSGVMNRRPIPNPAWTSVGILATSSYVTWKEAES
jgi:hypothetical protein